MMAVQWVSQRASVKGVPTPTPARLTGRGTTEAQHTSLSHCCGFVSEATGPAQAGDLVSLSVHVLGGTAPSCPPWVGGGAPREALGARRPRQQHRRRCAECQRRDLCGLTQARQPPHPVPAVTAPAQRRLSVPPKHYLHPGVKLPTFSLDLGLTAISGPRGVGSPIKLSACIMRLRWSTDSRRSLGSFIFGEDIPLHFAVKRPQREADLCLVL